MGRDIDVDIKYRAYSKNSKFVQGVTAIDFIDHTIWCGLEKIEYGDFVLMAFTGLQDKEGVEIYEGDIIRRCKDEIEGEVVFIDGICEVLVDGDYDHNLQYWCFCCGKCEVIGNIWEHSHLLGKEVGE